MDAQILDAISFCQTMPNLPSHFIPRDSFLSAFEESLDKEKFQCVEASEGVGISTTLAMFAKHHSTNSISFFFDRFLQESFDVENFEDSLARQLFYIVTGEIPKESERYSFKPILFKSIRKINSLYIILDDINAIPNVNMDSVRQVLLPLIEASNTRFLVSGTLSSVKGLFNTITNMPCTKLVKFSQFEVKSYLNEIFPDITDNQISIMHDLSGGNAEQLTILINKIQMSKSFDVIDNIYQNNITDFYEEDCKSLLNIKNDNVKLFLALLTYANFDLSDGMILSILNISEETLNEIITKCDKFVKRQNNIYSISDRSFRKYLHKQLSQFKNKIEMVLIGFFENNFNVNDLQEETYQHLPALYKSQNKKQNLVTYLKSDKVQDFLYKQKSLSAVNLQCD
ncbi:MAG: hypothetical protein IJ263_10405, partial [Paludibacteraceae bacterium]|nr:hypothetical protein [Paludibacteraceae bacterium]